MKKIATCLLSLVVHCLISQNGPAVQSNTITMNKNNSCVVVYSEDHETLVYQDSLHAHCREIAILTLPPLTQSLTPLEISFSAKGSYTIKSDPDLDLPENKVVYIEDMLTGMTFDLKSPKAFSFSVNRNIPNRFMLHIEKYAVLSSSAVR